MDNPWIALILLALAAAFLPWQFSAEVLILRKERGFGRATAFVGGITIWRFLIGIVLAFVFAGGLAVAGKDFGTIIDFVSAGFQSGVESVENRPGRVLDVVLVLAGLLLLVRAIRSGMGEPDPDAPPPKILGTIDSMSARAAFGFGVVWMALSAPQWVFLITGVQQILSFDTGALPKLGAYILFIAVSSLLILSPLVLYAIQPAQAQARLAAMEKKVDGGMRYIGVLLQGGVGLYLIWRGLLHLSGG